MSIGTLCPSLHCSFLLLISFEELKRYYSCYVFRLNRININIIQI